MRSKLLLGLALLGQIFFSGCVNGSKRFAVSEVSPGLYEGFKPTSKAHFQMLRAHGIRTIFSVEALPWDKWSERRLALQSGFAYVNVPIPATPFKPSEKRVKEALLVLHNATLRPVYMHCLLGRDRTALIAGLYRVYYEDWTPEAAWNEMLRLGFKRRWSLRGFETYFWRHCQKPKWATHKP